MRLLDYEIPVPNRSHRVEIFPFYDTHVGKRNCFEAGIQKQVQEILRQDAKEDRTCRVLLGGDTCDFIKPQDIRYNVDGLADWFYIPDDGGTVQEKLADIAACQVDRAAQLFKPVEHLLIGGLCGNHEETIQRRYNTDIQKHLCRAMNMEDLTDECVIRFRFKRGRGTATVKLYMRHGFGGGRTAGAEPAKIERMMSDGVAADCDVCLTGHSHTFCVNPPEPVLYIPNRGKMPPELLTRYRFGANPGCWLLSHQVGKATYESRACYPTRPMMTLKIVIWPFWRSRKKGVDYAQPKIELRDYRIQ